MLCLSAVALLASASGAVAKPPAGGSSGQSAASQYIEDVPTAGGGVPDSGVPSQGPSSSIPAHTLSQLTSSPTGSRAAGLAEALAPRPATPTAHHTRPAHRTAPAHRSRPRERAGSGATRRRTTAVEAAKTFTTASGAGVSLALPIILAGLLVLASVAGVVRIRRSR